MKTFYPRLNEIISQQAQQYGYNKDKRDIAINEIEKFIIDKLTTSPISFKHIYTKEGFNVEGPFNTYIHIGFTPHQAASSDYFHSQKEKSATYFVRTNIESWESPTAKELIKKLKSSVEFKNFIKGATIDKMRKAKLNQIIKTGYSPESFLSYIKYMSPDIVTDKQDTSGPWATTGTSIHTYRFNLKDLFDKWKIEKYEQEELLDSFKQDILKTRGYTGGYLTSIKINKWEYNSNTSVLTIQVQSTTYYN